MKQWIVKFKAETEVTSRVVETIVFARDKLQAIVVFESQFRTKDGKRIIPLYVLESDEEMRISS